MTRNHRTTWTTVQVRAVDVNLHDVVVHAGHAWQVMEGERYDAHGNVVDGPAAEVNGIVAVMEVNLSRVVATGPRGGTPSTGWGDEIRAEYRSARLLLTPDDLVTIQVPAGTVHRDAGLGRE